VFDHYLGWTVNGGSPPDHFNFLDASTVPFAREWGMRTALHDARRVVRAAGRGGRRVLLGGHSLGASLTAAYAAWDFHGRPGYRDLGGLVLIDGGLLGSFDAYDLGQAQQQIAELENSNPFLDLLGTGIPEAAGLFAEIGGIYGRNIHCSRRSSSRPSRSRPEPCSGTRSTAIPRRPSSASCT
jgi:pimeloyl-ACP methyl ester carboxylesterase